MSSNNSNNSKNWKHRVEVLEHGDFWVGAWRPEGQSKYTRQWLQQEFSMGRKRELCLLWGHQPAEDGQLTKSCLSQWWMGNFWSIANSYLCLEQYMMARSEPAVLCADGGTGRAAPDDAE